RPLAMSHFTAPFQEALDLRVSVEVGRQASLRFEQFGQLCAVQAGFDFFHVGVATPDVALPNARMRLRSGYKVRALGDRQFFVELFRLYLRNSIGLFARDFPQSEQTFQIAVAYSFALFDGAVQHRMSEGGLVALVVATAAITVHVDDHVALK